VWPRGTRRRGGMYEAERGGRLQMILPNVRASFGRAEAGAVLGLLTAGDSQARERQESRLREEGFDALLDDPRTLNALLTARGAMAVSPSLVFYVMVRHALLECGVRDATLADYLAALLLAFGEGDRAYRIEETDGERFHYLVDIVAALDTADGRRSFLLRMHLGNLALWFSGLFPDRIAVREQRRGAPGLHYYEDMGRTGYRMAAQTRDATECGLDALLRECADAFPLLRVTLNRISDRYFFPRRGDPVFRLLRQMTDGYGHDVRPN
jgi:hypothetical protein